MRVPSNTGSKFPTQKPSIDKVAEHIDDVVTVATSITSGQFDKVSVPAVGVVAGIHKQVVAVAEVEQYVRMLALDLSNVGSVAKELGGVLNVSNNMATVLLLHSRMADLLNIQKSLVHINAVALNEARINSVYKAIPDITTLVSHTDKLVRIVGMEPQLNAVFQNLNVILELGSNVEHLVNVSTHIDAVVKASSSVDALEELFSSIQAVEANLRVIAADTANSAASAGSSAVASGNSAAASLAYSLSAEASKNTAGTSAIAALASENLAAEWANKQVDSAITGNPGSFSSKHWALKSQQWAGVVSSILIWKGAWSAAMNTAPPTPALGTGAHFYRISGAGTISGTAYAVGDYIHWDTIALVWFKIDGTDAVTSVNGKSGAVILKSADVDALPSGGTAVAATKLETARNIGGVAFDGTANISLPGVNATGNQSTTGNAATATRLHTARTIALTGDVTGSVNFDGSGNVSITTTVADDSHNHTIANIVDLQNTLNGKLSTSGKAADSDKLDGLDSSQFLRSDTSSTMTGNLTVTGTAAATKHQAPTHNVGTGSTGFDIAYNSTTKSLDFNFVG